MGEVDLEDYAKLFALRLRQFDKDYDAINCFLTYYFFSCFHREMRHYCNFLSNVKKQKRFLSKFGGQQIENWMSVAGYLIAGEQPVGHEGASGEKQEQPGQQDLQETATTVPLPEEELAEEEPLTNYFPRAIKGTFTHAEIQHFFSFLTVDKGKGEGAYLSDEAVEEIFRNGIVIPEKPLAQKHKLNYTHRFPKKIVNYFIYNFISRYNIKAKNGILIFLGSYIEEYSQALTPQGLKNLNKNITGERPSNRFFNLADFLPQRLQ